MIFNAGRYKPMKVEDLAIAYTGTMTDEIVTMTDGQYRLLTLTSSGTLSISQTVQADIWMCGGGSHGGSGSYPQRCDGGGGGYVNSEYNQKIKSAVAVVGAATGTSSFGEISAAGATDENGGSGGGGGYRSAGGTGAGISTYPFNDTTFFSGKPHCPGGGGGADISYSEKRDDAGKDPYYCGDGGNGGTNGGSGSAGAEIGGYWPRDDFANSGTGGVFGGGHGGEVALFTPPPTDGRFYGAGGGGAYDYDGSHNRRGAGYQGVIYVRIPLDQKAA